MINNLGNNSHKGHQVEMILQKIIYLPLWSIGRAGDMQWFAFGNERREVTTRNGEVKIVSDYSLHVQCAWRIRKQNSIIVASRDKYYPAGENPYAGLEEFEWDTPDSNRLDELVTKLLIERSSNPLIALSVDADLVGGVTISLSDNYNLEIFPDDSLPSEYWRFFKPYGEEEHFIVTGHGIEYE